MTSADREPTRDELAAMAYADGELAPEERRSFEARMASSPALARDVTEYQRLQALSRHAAPAEPMDHEWQRLGQDPLQQLLSRLGWALSIAGVLGLAAWGVLGLVTSDLPLLGKLGLGGVLLGAAALALSAVRARLRTRPYDRYTEIQR